METNSGGALRARATAVLLDAWAERCSFADRPVHRFQTVARTRQAARQSVATTAVRDEHHLEGDGSAPTLARVYPPRPRGAVRVHEDEGGATDAGRRGREDRDGSDGAAEAGVTRIEAGGRELAKCAPGFALAPSTPCSAASRRPPRLGPRPRESADRSLLLPLVLATRDGKDVTARRGLTCLRWCMHPATLAARPCPWHPSAP
jgi:hypothetical protein